MSDRISVQFDRFKLARIDKVRGERSRPAYVRAAIDTMLKGPGEPLDYSEWVRSQSMARAARAAGTTGSKRINGHAGKKKGRA